MNTQEAAGSHDTYEILIECLQDVPDPRPSGTFGHVLLDILVIGLCAMITALEDEIVAIDGKALRRTLSAGDKIPSIVSARAVKYGLSMDQVKVDEKAKEITAIPELLW